MYAVPYLDENQGSTEQIIGSWLKKTGSRDKIILASKIVGPSNGFTFIRDPLDFSTAAIDDALHKSLSRMQTDYLDLYQLHWPERNVNIFGQRDYNHSGNREWEDNIAKVLESLESFVKQGKIRQIGLSNETPWGVMRYCEEAKKGAPKMITVQNAYNLLNRRDEIGLSEVLLREDVGYLAYSPLAFGVLAGKYLNNNQPENARVTLFPNYSRYSSEQSNKATILYNDIAKKYEISLTQMALAFVTQQPFMTSNIIGATTMDQLKENINSIHLTLSDEIIRAINLVHAQIPNPAP